MAAVFVFDDEESSVVPQSSRRSKTAVRKPSVRKVGKKSKGSSIVSHKLAEGERGDICFDYRAGNCTRGASCKFFHDPKYNFGFNDANDDRRTLFQSVRALAAQKLSGWQKREWEEKVRIELGTKAKKAQKMPIKMLMGIRKKRKHIQTRREQCNREQDVVTAKKRKKVIKKKRGKVWLNSQRFDGGVTKGVMRIREQTK